MPNLRPGRRRGGGGKSAVILDLIEHYWNQIEGDFFDRGADARDWIRGIRPWDQFLNYCVTIAQTPGTRLQAAQLNDDRYLPEFEKLFDEQKKRKAAPARPPIEGFDRTVEAIYDLSDDIRLLIQVLTKVDLKFRPRPETPFDRMKERKKAATLARIEKLLE